MQTFRRHLRVMAYFTSLIVAGAAVWMPTSAMAQVTTGSPFGGTSGGGGGVSLGGTNTWTALQTFQSGLTVTGGGLVIPIGQEISFGSPSGTAFNRIQYRSEGTPDQTVFGTGTTSNAWLMAEVGDITFDFAHPLQTNPTLFFENAAQDTTQHQGLAYYGAQGRAIKTLTEGAATSAIRIPVAAGAGVGGILNFTVFASDATDHQTLTGSIQYAAVNKAAVETCAVPTAQGTPLNSVSAGTLTCTFACDTTPANAVDIQFNCTSSLTQTTLDVYYRLDALGASEPLPQ